VNALPVVELEPLIVGPVHGVSPVSHIGVAPFGDLTSYLFFMLVLETPHVVITEVLPSLHSGHLPKKVYNSYFFLQADEVFEGDHEDREEGQADVADLGVLIAVGWIQEGILDKVKGLHHCLHFLIFKYVINS
jgi:hypothetical protein